MSAPDPQDAAAPVPATATLEALFEAYEPALLLYAQRIVGDDDMAQDIVQDAFTKLADGFDQVRQPRPWLYRTVHNLALNRVRAQHKIVPLPQDTGTELQDARPLPDESLQRLETIGQTRRCLGVLDARSRELLRLKFEEDLSYQEMGARLQLSVGHVGYLLHHALKRLAVELQKTGVIP